MDGDHRRKDEGIGMKRWRQYKGVVEKGHCLWRTCGMQEMLREWKGFGEGRVEIFCSTWNVLRRNGDQKDKG